MGRTCNIPITFSHTSKSTFLYMYKRKKCVKKYRNCLAWRADEKYRDGNDRYLLYEENREGLNTSYR